MLMPKKVKHRKQFKGRMKGAANCGAELNFGDFGLQALECGWLSSRQIEAARRAMTRYVKRGGKIWIRVFPDRVRTEKPAEVRQGKGKGSPVGWFAPVKPGRVLYEIKGVDIETAKEALTRAQHKLPIKTKIVVKEGL